MGLTANIVNNSGVVKNLMMRPNGTMSMQDLIKQNAAKYDTQAPVPKSTVPIPKSTVPVSPALRNVASDAVRNSLFGKGSFQSSNANLNSIRSNIAKANGATEGTAAYKSNLGYAQKYLDAAAKSTGQARTNNMALARKELETAHSIMTPKIVSAPFKRMLYK